MRRDMDLIRELLLHIENLPGSAATNHHVTGYSERINFPGWEPNAINHHLQMLGEGGLVILTRSQPADGSIITMGLTREGRDFLDSVRDPEVWRRTREGASTMGGWTFDLLKDMAKAYLKHVAKERLGLNL